MWRLCFSLWSAAGLLVQAFPTFDEVATLTTTEVGAQALARGDLDGDGLEDIVYVAGSSNRVGWFRNLGDHFDSRKIISSLAIGVSHLDLADVDGDGDVDVVVGSPGNNRVILFKNTNGTGQTWTMISIAPIQVPQAIAFADINRDGAPDIVTTDADQLIWLNNSSGDGSSWVSTVIETNLTGVIDLLVSDLDKDGALDVVSTSSAGPVSLHINMLGDGSTWLNQAILPLAFASDLELADINRDGLPDLILAVPGLNTLAWLPNQGAHSFGAATTIADNLSSVWALTSGDLDSDGWVDIVVGLAGDDVVMAFPGLAGSVFAAPVLVENSFNDPHALLLMDTDMDGDEDVFFLSTSDADIGVAINENMHRRADAFCDDQLVGSVANASTVYTAAADLDGNGKMDLLTLEDSGATLVAHLNNLLTGFDRVVLRTGLSGARHLETVDLDRDGVLDVITHSFDFLDERLLMINGSTLVTTELNTLRYKAAVFAVADLDRDGDADIVAGSDTSNDIRWFVNAGAPIVAMSPTTIATGVTDPRDIAIGDLDGDGRLDVVVSSGAQDRVTWYKQPAFGSWQSRTINATMDNPERVELADMDGDGDLDVVHTAGGGLLWYENTLGNGTSWTTHMLSNAAFGPHLQVRDVDADGDQDLVVIQPDDGQIYLYESLDPAQVDGWNIHRVSAGTGVYRSLALADYSGKGRLAAGYTIDARIGYLDACIRHAGVSSVPLAPLTGTVSTPIELLRINYQHEGRPGDLAMALKQLLLRPNHGGTPFSSQAEFDQMIERLEVYRDDGTGRYEESADELVPSVFTGFNPVSITLDDVVQREIAPGESVGFIVVAIAEPAAYLSANRSFGIERLADAGELSTVRADGQALDLYGLTGHSGDVLWSGLLSVSGDIRYTGIFNAGINHYLGAVVGRALNSVLSSLGPGQRAVVQGNTADLEPGTGPWSISAWVNTRDAAQTQAFVGKQQASGIHEGWVLGISRDAGSRQPFLELRADADNELIWVAEMTLSDNTWYHLAATWDGGTGPSSVRVYINGVEVQAAMGSGSLGQPVASIFAELALGASSGPPSLHHLDGAVDEVAIWNVELGSLAVQALFQQGVDPQAPGLRGFWAFDDGTANDQVDALRIGTLTAALILDNRAPSITELVPGFGTYMVNLPGDFSYELFAWIDANGNGLHEVWEPSGVHSNRIDLQFATVSGVDITFTDTFNIDSDGDGVPDFFEFAWFNDPIAAEVDADIDGDGYTLAQEYIMDTSPVDANDFLRVTDVLSSVGQPPKIVFSGSNTRVYTLQSTPNPGDTNNWMNVAGQVRIPGIGSSGQAIEGLDSTSNRLYRVLVELP
jgi:hypothetical protein